jgi:hypothetical protein
MPRKYAVLKQFALDLDRLLREAESGFGVLKTVANPTQAQILAVYRPVHSLKGICGMVEETKLLVRAFHALEDTLPPLVAVRALKNARKKAEKPDWTAIAGATFKMAREVERILLAKLELWKKLGADDNETRGLVVHFTHAGVSIRTWIGITALLGLVDAAEAGEEESIGYSSDTAEALLVEMPDSAVALYFDEIETTCTRLEAVQKGVPMAFKDWWTAHQKSRTSRAA